MKVIEEYRVRKAPAGAEVGIEIEMEGDNLPTVQVGLDTKFWKGTVDGSLRGENAEWVLSSPIPREDVAKALQELQKYLKDRNAVLRPSDRAGVHVHVNCQQMEFEETLNFVLLYLMFEEPLVKFCGEQREGNLFCLRSSDAEDMIRAIRQATELGSFRNMQNDNYRYASVNLSALRKYGSIEFRAMRSVENFADINTWVELLLKVRDASLKFKKPNEIIESMSHNGSTILTRNVFDHYSDLIQCSNMQDVLMRGARRIQEIAYTPIGDYAARIKKEQEAMQRMVNPAHGTRHVDGHHVWIRSWREVGVDAERRIRANLRAAPCWANMARMAQHDIPIPPDPDAPAEGHEFPDPPVPAPREQVVRRRAVRRPPNGAGGFQENVGGVDGNAPARAVRIILDEAWDVPQFEIREGNW